MDSIKNWMFYFGCYDMNSIAGEEYFRITKDKTFSSATFPKIFDPIRKKLINLLIKSGEFTNVTDLYFNPPTAVFFNPIVADIHIPLSMQSTDHITRTKPAAVEDFKIIYDGFVLTIAAQSPSKERPCGVYDARDKFKALLEMSSIPYEEVPPTLTHRAIIVTHDKDEVNDFDIFLSLKDNLSTDLSFIDLARSLYVYIIQDMQNFYECCSTSNKLSDKISSELALESMLLKELKTFVKCSSWRFWTKKQISNNCHRKIIDILGNLSEHSEITRELEKGRQLLNLKGKENPTLQEFTKKVCGSDDEYVKPAMSLDVDSSIRLIEHSRIELEEYSSATSTIVSALVGALIGSVLTIVVAFFSGAPL